MPPPRDDGVYGPTTAAIGGEGGRGLAPEGSKIHSIVIEKIKTISKKQ
jgi:hypothetical protein